MTDKFLRTPALATAIILSLVIVLAGGLIGASEADPSEGIQYIDDGGALASIPETDVTFIVGNSPLTELGKIDGAAHWYVVSGNVIVDSRITIMGNVHLILEDGASLDASNGGIKVSDGNLLTIYAQSTEVATMGSISASGNNDQAGIGGDYNENTGTITINGGKISASGGYLAAGIGGGNGGDGGNVTINNGTVTAEGGYLAAGIGGGNGGDGGSITIKGGSVETTGGDGGAGMGGGYTCGGGTIAIEGGTIIASGNNGGSGIGGGEQGDGGSTIIIGGTVTAIGGVNGSGIGGGFHGDGGTITIEGGTVKATGGDYCAGIGGGNTGAGGTITIGGGHITATGGDGGHGIGDGADASGSTFSTGVKGHAIIFTDSISDSGDTSRWGGIIFQGDEGTVYGDQVLSTDLTLEKGQTLTVPKGNSLTVPKGVSFTNHGNVDNEGTFSNSGHVSNHGTFTNNGDIINDGTFYSASGINDFQALPFPEREVLYIDEKGELKHTSPDVEVNVINGDYCPTNLGANDGVEHWYVVSGNVVADSRIIVTGNVHLILMDRSLLDATKGGIDVSEDNSLTIYAQSTGDDMGSITATGNDDESGIGGGDYESGGTITINGGKITANGGLFAAGIGGGISGIGGTITINGGDVTATADSFGAGIGGGSAGAGGTITITGGTVTATGGTYAAGIGGCTSGDGGTITIYGGTIEAVGSYGAGIGGGSDGGCGTITITGGSVTATGGISDAGIGSGDDGTGGSIFISGGTVVARNGGYGGAGIGVGERSEIDSVTITGGTVTAISNGPQDRSGAGISAGGGRIVITGGTITARGHGNGAGIGAISTSAADGDAITISGGLVTAIVDGTGPGIGGGAEQPSTFSTGADGHAIIHTNGISAIDDTSEWRGIIFIGDDGIVYGNQTLTSDLEIDSGTSLTIPSNNILRVSPGTVMTVNGQLIVEGGLIVGNPSQTSTGNGLVTGAGVLIGNGSVTNNGIIDLPMNGFIANVILTMEGTEDGTISIGSTVTLTATVTYRGEPLTEGIIGFYAGDVLLASMKVDEYGTATCIVTMDGSVWYPGEYTITAEYILGDGHSSPFGDTDSTTVTVVEASEPDVPPVDPWPILPPYYDDTTEIPPAITVVDDGDGDDTVKVVACAAAGVLAALMAVYIWVDHRR